MRNCTVSLQDRKVKLKFIKHLWSMIYTFFSPVGLSPFSLFAVLEWSIFSRAYDALDGNKSVKGLPRITLATATITRRCARSVKYIRIWKKYQLNKKFHTCINRQIHPQKEDVSRNSEGRNKGLFTQILNRLIYFHKIARALN